MARSNLTELQAATKARRIATKAAKVRRHAATKARGIAKAAKARREAEATTPGLKRHNEAIRAQKAVEAADVAIEVEVALAADRWPRSLAGDECEAVEVETRRVLVVEPRPPILLSRPSTVVLIDPRLATKAATEATARDLKRHSDAIRAKKAVEVEARLALVEAKAATKAVEVRRHAATKARVAAHPPRHPAELHLSHRISTKAFIQRYGHNVPDTIAEAADLLGKYDADPIWHQGGETTVRALATFHPDTNPAGARIEYTLLFHHAPARDTTGRVLGMVANRLRYAAGLISIAAMAGNA